MYPVDPQETLLEQVSKITLDQFRANLSREKVRNVSPMEQGDSFTWRVPTFFSTWKDLDRFVKKLYGKDFFREKKKEILDFLNSRYAKIPISLFFDNAGKSSYFDSSNFEIGINVSPFRKTDESKILKTLKRELRNFSRRVFKMILEEFSSKFESKFTRSLMKLAYGWKKYPKGWTEESVRKWFSNFAEEGIEGSFTRCVDKMKKHMKNPEGMCAAAKDSYFGGTDWRGKGL